jgi:hypothetical protein
VDEVVHKRAIVVTNRKLVAGSLLCLSVTFEDSLSARFHVFIYVDLTLVSRTRA